MSEVVFILGAGASQQCGAPLMNDFLDKSRDLLASGEVNEKRAHFEKVFSAISKLQVVHSKAILDLNNIESIFNIFEMSRLLKKLPGYDVAAIEDIIKSLKEVIVTTLECKIRYPTVDRKIHPPTPYEGFIDILSYIQSQAQQKHSVSVITFNYDIALDMAFHYGGLTYDYYLNESVEPNRIPLLKLHGSLNWAVCSVCGEIVPWYLHEYFSKYSVHWFTDPKYVKIPIGVQLTTGNEHCGAKVLEEPFIVPPTWNKAEHHQTLSKVWSRAAHELSEAEYIFVIGYSLPETDAFFKLLYAMGAVGNKIIRCIIVFNPDGSGRVDDRFRNILGFGAIDRYTYNKNRFEDAIPLIKAMFPIKIDAI